MKERESGEPYPYAKPKTFEFLKAAIADGAHIELPYGLSEDEWVRRKNITGIYLSCDITKDELGKIYGLSRQRVDQIVAKTIVQLWENSGAYTRGTFPREMESGNPNSKHRLGIGRKKTFILMSSIKEGLDDKAIIERTGLNPDLVRQVIRRAGRNDLITTASAISKRAISALRVLPFEKYEERQEAIDQLGRGYLYRNKELFASLSEMAVLFGRKVQGARLAVVDAFVLELKGMCVPVGIMHERLEKANKERRYLFVWRGDYQRIKDKLSSKDSGETPGPSA